METTLTKLYNDIYKQRMSGRGISVSEIMIQIYAHREKEREQLCDAFVAGASLRQSFDEYFESTFNQPIYFD